MHTDAHGFYAILDVDPTASEQLIRAAFRHRAKQVHPDVAPDRTLEFIALKRAYDTLSNPSTRADYDRACFHANARPAPSAPRSPPYPVSVPPAVRRSGAFSTYAFAFSLMTAIVLVFVGFLVSFAGAPPPPAPSITETGFGEHRAKVSKSSGATDDQSSESTGTGESTEGTGDAARQGSTLFPERSRRPSGNTAPRHSDTNPGW